MVIGLALMALAQTPDYYSLVHFPATSLTDKWPGHSVPIAKSDNSKSLRLKIESGLENVTVRVENHSGQPVLFPTVARNLQAYFEIYDGSEWQPIYRMTDCGTGQVFGHAKLLPQFGWTYKCHFSKGDFNTKVRWSVVVGKKTISTKEIEVTTEKPKSMDHGLYDVTIASKKSGYEKIYNSAEVLRIRNDQPQRGGSMSAQPKRLLSSQRQQARKAG